jgi:DNA-binding NtrC family response regulator
MGGNRTRTAKALGISLRGLQYKLRAYRTNDQDSSDSDASMGRHA